MGLEGMEGHGGATWACREVRAMWNRAQRVLAPRCMNGRPGPAGHHTGGSARGARHPARNTPVERSLAPRSTMVHASLSAQPLKWIMRSSPIIISSIT